MINVDKDKCVKCGKCVSICPFTVIQITDGYPQKIENKVCLKCMHCAATCKNNAILFDGKPAIIGDSINVCSEEFIKNLKMHIMTRRSYRHFQQRPVDQELVTEALDVASWGPSAKNQHPSKWIVVNDSKVIEKIMVAILKYSRKTGTSPEIISEYEEMNNNVVMGTAPTLILCYARNNAINSAADCAIAMTTAELVLQAEGVGTCWAGYLTRSCNNIEEIKELLPKLPDNNSFYGAFMAGYPENEDYPNIPTRIKRADIKFV